ncbi:MAG: thiamine pyrophosphate-binding protein [Rhodocyclaceae bacterium]|nr:thiamine pyrophosphate-binding protein [Rhodocyclaceae bacterium]
MKITIAELIVRFMERLKITCVFGMPGAHILPVYDQLRSSSIRTFLVKHEQGASFMSSGFYRAGGGIAACITTAGPGATNLATGLANAYADNLPMLAITGETSTWIFGKGGLQEGSGQGGSFDLSAMLSGITRYHCRIDRPDDLATALQQTVRILQAPHSGPVCLVLPYDIQKMTVDDALLDRIFLPPSPPPPPSHPDIWAWANFIEQARAPVLIAGQGCQGAHTVLNELTHRFNLPVATTLKGKGCLPDDAPQSLGCLGITSDGRAFHTLAEQADALVFLGASFNERTSHLWNNALLSGKKIAQIDHDPTRLGRNFTANLSLCHDVSAVLDRLLARLVRDNMPPKANLTSPPRLIGAHFEWIEQFFTQLTQRFPQGTQVIDDNILLAQTHFFASPRHRYFPNAGISSLGHAIPAALGARLARDVPTFAILGDGGFQMCGMELMTAVNYRIPINVLMINNGTLGLIRKNQFQLYEGRHIDCDFINPDFALLARAFGIPHYRIESTADVSRLFEEADLIHAINLIEIPWDKNLFPGYRSDR